MELNRRRSEGKRSEIQELNLKSLESKYERMHPESRMSFESVAGFLTRMGDAISAEDLKAWFTAQDIDPKLFDIQDSSNPGGGQPNGGPRGGSGPSGSPATRQLYEYRKGHKVIERRELVSKKEYVTENGKKFDSREFEARLTALIWFVDSFTDIELEKIVPGHVDYIKRKISEIRHIWDSLEAPFLRQTDIDYIYEASESAIIMSEVPQHIRGQLEFGRGFFRPGESTRFRLIDMFRAYMEHQKIDPTWGTRSTATAFQLRSPAHRRIALLSALIMVRNQQERVFGLIKENASRKASVLKIADRISRGFKRAGRYGNDLFDPNEELTLSNVPRYLQFMNDSISTLGELDEWFNSDEVKKYGVTMEFFDIQDKAMTVHRGGIDLNSSKMQLNVRKEGLGVMMRVDQAMIERIKREGIESLSPVIFRITTIQSIWPRLGMDAPKV
jgi:hypothetical protein